MFVYQISSTNIVYMPLLIIVLQRALLLQYITNQANVVFYLMQISQVDLFTFFPMGINLIQLQSTLERKLCMYALFDPFTIPEIMSIRFCNKKYVYVCANTVLRYYLPFSL